MHTRPTIFHLHHFRCSQTLCIMCIAHRFVKSFYGSWNYIRALSIEFAFQHFDPDLRKCHPNTVIATPQFMLQTVCVSVCMVVDAFHPSVAWIATVYVAHCSASLHRDSFMRLSILNIYTYIYRPFHKKSKNYTAVMVNQRAMSQYF